MNPGIKTLLVIVARVAWPYLIGRAAGEAEIDEFVNAALIVGVVAYHVYQRVQGQQKARLEKEALERAVDIGIRQQSRDRLSQER